MSNTKIVVIKRKQLLYTGIIIVVAVAAVLLLYFLPRRTEKPAGGLPQYNTQEAKYKAGVYTSVISLNDNLLNLEVIVDKDHINSICISNLNDSITTMYPLVEPALEQLAQQFYLDTAFEDIKLSEDSKYTQTLLLNAIRDTLAKAEMNPT